MQGSDDSSTHENDQSIHYDEHQRGKIVGLNGKTLGYVSENGFLYDRNRNLLGYVSQQGLVRDLHLHLVGHVDLVLHRFPFEAGRPAFFLLTQTEAEEQ